MTTIEKLFVQIFERKNSIIQQVKQQTDLYNQHLASKLLIDGITPPPWLWNPNKFNSEVLDPKELKKEELISELLLPHPRPVVLYPVNHCYLYDKAKTVPGCHDNDIGRTLDCIHELELRANSPQRQVEVRISNYFTAPDQSLVRLQRGIKPSRIASQQVDRALAEISDVIIDNGAVRLAKEECLKGTNIYCGRITRSISSCNLSSRDSKHLELLHASDIDKDFGIRMTRSQSNCPGGISKPVHSSNTASQRVARSKSGASKKFLLAKSLKRLEEFILQKVSHGEVIPHYPDIDAPINKEAEADYITETEPVSDGSDETLAACSEPNFDAAGLSLGLEFFVSRPPSDCSMFVKPKTLDFADVEECNLKETSSNPMMVKEMLEKSSGKKCCTSVKSATSLDKVTFHSRKSLEEKSLDQEVSIKTAGAWREECVQVDEEESKSDTNKNRKNVEDNSEALLEIQRPPVSHEEDAALSNVGHAEGLKSSPKLQVKEGRLGCFGRDRSETTPSEFKNQKLGQSFVSISHEGDPAQSRAGKYPKAKMQQNVSYQSTLGIKPLSELQLEKGELGSEWSTNTPSAFKHGKLGRSFVSSLTNEEAGDSPGCSINNMGSADTGYTTRSVLDGRKQCDEQYYKNLLHSENNVAIEDKVDLSIMQKIKPHFEKDCLYSYCSAVSPQNKHLASVGLDQTSPKFEGFIVDAEENGQPHLLPCILHCRSFSTTFKLHGTPDLYQSLPNGLLEHLDLRNTLNLSDDGGKQLRASNSCVDEVNCAFQGVSNSAYVPCADARYGWSSKNVHTSPGGKLWNRIFSKSSSSEKQQSLNPELTCFPIEEDPSISGDNENSDEVTDTMQEDIYSTVMSCGGEREPLTESTEACVDPTTSVTTIERFADRSSLDSINTEVSISGTRSRVKQKHENRYSSKRRCTNVGKENRTLSISTNCAKRATKSHKNRFSKPKVSRKISLRNGGLSLSEKVFKHDNIVSNITSFVPLVQQKQAAAVVTGKRDIKVKALEAAEAAKRLEEKRQKEREMKKEALKVERARIGQENLRQIELKKKKKEEEQKKKDAVMAARKRLREEDERKEKERKRKRIDEARQQQRREQEEKLRVGKVEKGVPFCSTDENVNNGKVSGGESRKHQIMVKERGDNNIVKKQQTEPRVAEISTSNVRQNSRR
ncbi:inner centromere protein, ARK-binding region protein [Actinidia rufa]|uniref:Inner centromere protein, ARK-binding region protein n=1 Tax=Actinidia rufa TaxID=165716 RepID=A0A7J0GP62_9ERIC|nr:inner centromere protein, ARK-binding region protein [Actinidia rufa]